MTVRWLLRQLRCVAPGCINPVRSKSLCHIHAYRLRKYGTHQKKPVSFRNPISKTHPEIASQLFDKNLGLVLTHGSSQRVEWVCKKGHRYFTTVVRKTTKHRSCGCPTCLKPWADKSKSLATKRPDLAREAFLFDPSAFGTSSTFPVWWLCSKCSHLWKTRIDCRVAGSGCPECGKCTFKVNQPAWLYLLKRPGQQKVGITNRVDGKDNRLTHHRGNGWTIIDVVGPHHGRKLKDVENQIKRGLDSKGVPRGKAAFRQWFDGYSEAWQTVDFEVASIAELLAALGVGGIENGKRQKTGCKSFTQDGIQPTTWIATGSEQVLVETAGKS